jgi:hypothetical protein
MTTPTFLQKAKKQEISAQEFSTYSDQELMRAYQKSRWYAILPINRAHLTMTLMNRGILKTYKNFTE